MSRTYYYYTVRKLEKIVVRSEPTWNFRNQCIIIYFMVLLIRKNCCLKPLRRYFETPLYDFQIEHVYISIQITYNNIYHCDDRLVLFDFNILNREGPLHV